MAKKTDIARAAPVARRLAGQLGFELVDVELSAEQTGKFLRFFIDKPDGVSLDDLEKYHRQIQPLMDDIDYDFMEVSSPGADRPLKTPDDYKGACGTLIELRFYRPIGGQKTVRGTLLGLEGDCVTIDVGGETASYTLPQIAKAAPVVDFDDVEMD